MRLVIPYRLAGDGLELKYAIRSMVRHFNALTGVLLIGDRPEWYDGDHIARADFEGEKEKSMQIKVMACQDPVFLYSNDDYYALEDFGIDLPNYHDTTCEDLAVRHQRKDYRRMYENCGPGWLNYDIHVPMIMRRDRFLATFEAMDGQTPIKTTYANGLVPGPYLADCKVRGEHNLGELEDLVKDRPFFSTHESVINHDFLYFINKLYPNASKWER